jgi:hypothetical protein
MRSIPIVFLNDGNQPGTWSYLNWYYHFAAEAILGGLTSLASIATSAQRVNSRESGLDTADTQGGGLTDFSLETEVPRLLIPWGRTGEMVTE